MHADNTYFEHKCLCKYIRVARGQDGGEVKSMIHLLLIKKICSVLRGVGRGVSDHHVMLQKVRLVDA